MAYLPDRRDLDRTMLGIPKSPSALEEGQYAGYAGSGFMPENVVTNVPSIATNAANAGLGVNTQDIPQAGTPFMPKDDSWRFGQGAPSSIPQAQAFIPGTETPLTEYNIRMAGGPESSKVTERKRWLESRQRGADEVTSRNQAQSEREAVMKQERDVEAIKAGGKERAAEVAGTYGVKKAEIGLQGKVYGADKALEARQYAADIQAGISNNRIKADIDMLSQKYDLQNKRDKELFAQDLQKQANDLESKGQTAEAEQLGKAAMNANIAVLQGKMMELQTETDPNKKAAIQSEIAAFAGKMTGAVKEARKGALPPLQAEGKQYSPEDYQFAANIVARYPKQEAAKMYASGKWTAEKFDAYLEADAALKARERKIRNKVTEQIMGQE